MSEYEPSWLLVDPRHASYAAAVETMRTRSRSQHGTGDLSVVVNDDDTEALIKVFGGHADWRKAQGWPASFVLDAYDTRQDHRDRALPMIRTGAKWSRMRTGK